VKYNTARGNLAEDYGDERGQRERGRGEIREI